MHDQAAHLRQLVRACVHADAALAPGGSVVTITGAQPAAGATTTACGLARQLARLGNEVILIDANLKQPRIYNYLGTHQSASPANSPDQAWSGLRGTLHEVLNGTRRAVEALTPTDEQGLRFIANAPSACGLAPPLDREALDRFATEIASLSHQVDFVLIDAGHGMSAWVDHLWQLSRQVLLVAPPTDQALLDGYAAVKLSQFDRHDNRLRFVANGAEDEADAASFGKRFEETCRRFLHIRPKAMTWLPAMSQHRQHANSDYTRAVRLLAADLIGDLRAAKLKVPRPRRTDLSLTHAFGLEELSQRRGGAEQGHRF